MSVVRCWNCGYEKKVDSLEEAQRLARVHMSMIGCIMVFGYTDAKYREALGLDDSIIAVEENGNVCNPEESEMLSGEWRDE